MSYIRKRRKVVNGVEIVLMEKVQTPSSVSTPSSIVQQGLSEEQVSSMLDQRVETLKTEIVSSFTGSTGTTILPQQQLITSIPESVTQEISTTDLLSALPDDPIDGNIIIYDANKNDLVWDKNPSIAIGEFQQYVDNSFPRMGSDFSFGDITILSNENDPYYSHSIIFERIGANTQQGILKYGNSSPMVGGLFSFNRSVNIDGTLYANDISLSELKLNGRSVYRYSSSTVSIELGEESYAAGYGDIAIGYLANKDHDGPSGSSVYIGASSGWGVKTGHNQTFVGYGSGRHSVSGYDNTHIGYLAGASANTKWSTSIGRGSMEFVSGESRLNTAVGNNSLYSGQNILDSIAIGSNALRDASGTQRGISIGVGAGSGTTSSRGVYIGYYAGCGTTADNLLIIDNADTIDPETPLLYGSFQSHRLSIGTADTSTYNLHVEGSFNAETIYSGGVDLSTLIAAGGGGITTLEGLSDTNIPSPNDGDVLAYDNATSKWISSASAGGGYGSGDSPLFTDLTATTITATTLSAGTIYSGSSNLTSLFSDINHVHYFSEIINTGHTHTHTDITDFDTEVSNNIDVAANTSARHSHSNKAQLDLITDGDHDVIIGNPHGTTYSQVGAAPAVHTHTHTDITDFDSATEDIITGNTHDVLSAATITATTYQGIYFSMVENTGHTHTESDITDLGDYAERTYFESHTAQTGIHLSLDDVEAQITGTTHDVFSADTIYSGSVDVIDVIETQITGTTHDVLSAATITATTYQGIDFSMVEDTGHTHTHASLEGLAEDDHTQYHNNTRAEEWLTGNTHDVFSADTIYSGSSNLTSLFSDINHEHSANEINAGVFGDGTSYWGFDLGTSSQLIMTGGGIIHMMDEYGSSWSRGVLYKTYSSDQSTEIYYAGIGVKGTGGTPTSTVVSGNAEYVYAGYGNSPWSTTFWRGNIHDQTMEINTDLIVESMSASTISASTISADTIYSGSVDVIDVIETQITGTTHDEITTDTMYVNGDIYVNYDEEATDSIVYFSGTNEDIKLRGSTGQFVISTSTTIYGVVYAYQLTSSGNLYLDYNGDGSSTISFTGTTADGDVPRLSYTNNEFDLTRGINVTGHVDGTSWIRAADDLRAGGNLHLDYDGDSTTSTHIQFSGDVDSVLYPRIFYSGGNDHLYHNRNTVITEGLKVGYSYGSSVDSGYKLDVNGTARTDAVVLKESTESGTDKFKISFNNTSKSLDFTYIG